MGGGPGGSGGKVEVGDGVGDGVVEWTGDGSGDGAGDGGRLMDRL